MMPSKDKANWPPDNQAPTIPPMAMLASNQKNQKGRRFMGDRLPWGVAAHLSEVDLVRLKAAKACGHKLHNC